MGQRQHTPPSGRVARPWQRRRTCLRKGCGRVYLPNRWNQRYCQDPECQRLVRRWQAAKRQRAHRRSPDNRRRHAEAEAKRRRERTAPRPSNDHTAAEKSSRQDRAWSRSRKNPAEFCDRPGCYEPLPEHSRAPARYCDHACRQAMRRVRDRERKWLSRNRYRVPRDLTLPASPVEGGRQCLASTHRNHEDAGPVGDYGSHSSDTLSCRTTARNSPSLSKQGSPGNAHSKTHSPRRSRPPPTL